MSMARFVVRKVLALLAVLLVVSAVVYFLGRGVVQGDIATVYIGDASITQTQRAEIRHRLGLDRPIYRAYFDWFGHAMTGDLGTSAVTQRSVVSELKQEFPVSLELAVLALLLTAAIGVPLGVSAAVHAGSAWDSIIRVALLTVFGVPAFVTAIILLLVSALYLGPLYQTQYISLGTDVFANLRGMLLPTIAVALPPAAITLQLTRATMIEALGEPHVTMAMAKGASPRAIKYVHAFKNVLPSVITLLALLFGLLLGGVVVVETVFNLPGLGRGMVEAINQRDFQLLVPQTVVIAAVFVIANTLAEVVHPLLDPRLSRG
jgi:peptide/nickel transport system permease protein